jgi:hypothetical protein
MLLVESQTGRRRCSCGSHRAFLRQGSFVTQRHNRIDSRGLPRWQRRCNQRDHHHRNGGAGGFLSSPFWRDIRLEVNRHSEERQNMMPAIHAGQPFARHQVPDFRAQAEQSRQSHIGAAAKSKHTVDG